MNRDSLIDDAVASKITKNFNQKLVEMVKSNYFDRSMISQKDLDKCAKATEPKPTLDQVAARLFDCHEKHLEKVEATRREVEELRFLKGGGDDIDIECKF